eukprot:CAMPEP_0115163988 /NCGR_PEP_ID=MMETSP0227-20121206/72797_1 /TAXON_ID=89957 /ORGANISM="Polarella glacialis, Strain CCMP 1383" /LENGTH=157 /DNA_ID=CAMNT_0002576319 /DNA_START=524 /DNA_END=994 /DNA_ORIENTATION=-
MTRQTSGSQSFGTLMPSLSVNHHFAVCETQLLDGRQGRAEAVTKAPEVDSFLALFHVEGQVLHVLAASQQEVLWEKVFHVRIELILQVPWPHAPEELLVVVAQVRHAFLFCAKSTAVVGQRGPVGNCRHDERTAGWRPVTIGNRYGTLWKHDRTHDW